MKKASILLVAIALAVFGLVACGDDDDDGDTTAAETTEATTDTAAAGGGGGGAIDITASETELAYDEKTVDTAAGTVTLNFDNPSQTPHDVAVEGSGGEVGKTDLISGSTTSTSLDLQSGEYTFYCTVPGHREAGMEGTINVN